MKTLIVYASMTGNTKKVADAIAKEIGATAKPVKEITKSPDVDLLFVGSGIFAGKPHQEIMQFLQRLPKVRGKKAAVFGTYGTAHHALDYIKIELEKKGYKVLSVFGCKGNSLWLFNEGHPEEDLDDARRFARSVLKMR